jgi:DNA-binding NarL/FixJ family response regulator
MTTRIVIADDHQLVRAGIAALLKDIAEVEVVGEACDGREAVRLAAELRPHVMFMDVAMPGMSGLEALALINETQPEVRVVILSMHDSEEHVLRALKLGAVGFMLKDAAPEELAQAIKAVTRGNTWLSAAVSKTVISSYLERSGSGSDEVQSLLTARQSQVLKMIAEGCSTKEVSYALNLSVKTIETYRTQIMDKLDIHDLPGLVRYAIRQGIIEL